MILLILSVWVSFLATKCSTAQVPQFVDGSFSDLTVKIERGQNLSNLYQSQRRLLGTIDVSQQNYMQKIFMLAIRNYETLVNNTHGKNTSESCFRWAKNKIGEAAVVGLNNHRRCFDKQMSIHLNDFRSKIGEAQVLSVFPTCGKRIDKVENMLICIDQSVIKDGDMTSVNTYKGMFNELSKMKNITASSVQQCMGIFETVLNPTLLYAKKEFFECVLDETVHKVSFFAENKLTPINFATDVTSFREKLIGLYEVHCSIVAVVERQHDELTKIYKNTVLEHYRNPDITERRNHNLTCCFRLPTFITILASAAVDDKSANCFLSQRLQFFEVASANIQNDRVKSSIMSCNSKKADSAPHELLNCFANSISRLTPNERKNFFFNTTIGIKRYNEEFLIPGINGCLQMVFSHLARLFNYASLRIDLCLEYQEDPEVCVEPAPDREYYTILRDFKVINDDHFSRIMDRLEGVLAFVPRLG